MLTYIIFFVLLDTGYHFLKTYFSDCLDDAYAACERIKAQGGNVVREAGPMQHGSTVIAFVEDPDGYKIELVQMS